MSFQLQFLHTIFIMHLKLGYNLQPMLIILFIIDLFLQREVRGGRWEVGIGRWEVAR